MKNLRIISLALVLAGFLFGTLSAQPVEVDKKIPKYKKTTGIKGNLNSIGSDTILNMMTLWAEGFQNIYPSVKIQIEGKGSSTAPPALIEGTAQIGPMSRKMKAKEIDAFEDKYGFKPTSVEVSLDALAIYVNKDNPIKSLSFEQADAIFSKTRKNGYPEDIKTWGQVGLKGEWSNKPISIYGRNSASGTYGFFKDHVLDKGDFKNSVKEQPGSASVVQGVSKDKYSIGYSGIGYKTSSVRALPLSEKKDGKVYEATDDNVLSGNYPLSRYLYINIVKNPGKQLDPLVKEFMKFILSYEGQQIVVKDGYMPLPYEVVMKNLKALD
ncbi:MAG: phosphate-binding protein [Ignavibacteriae bacterium HGW-Ignavibacteriae-2]|jgi:phosphate transport system substrate-binding protein|nr:MAG: phosphate-binding protein [Ignavibacteriae bacterium HGW-Ignavibacteriae-2]